MNWTIIISIIALLLGLTAIIMSIMWHGVKGPIGIQGRTGKDVSGELNRAVTELDALKTTVESHNKTLNNSIIFNTDLINKNDRVLRERIGAVATENATQIGNVIHDTQAKYALKTLLTSTLKDYIKLDSAGTSTKYAIQGHDMNPDSNEGAAWLGTEGQDNELGKTWNVANWINTYRRNYKHAKKETALPITFSIF